MEVRILGTHNLESDRTRLTSVLIDNVLALDAGGLTSGLSFDEQRRVSGILLTHYHFDHIRDIPVFGLAHAFVKTTPVYSTPAVLEALTTHLINGKLYPRLDEWPPGMPAFSLRMVEPLREAAIGEHTVVAVPVGHSVPAVGYQVTDAAGKSLFYTGDTGVGLSSCWSQVSPRMIIIELTGPNRLRERMVEAGHLCPDLLKQELRGFLDIRGYRPRVVVTHLTPQAEAEIRVEAARVAAELGIEITVAEEGMKLEL